jgi:hypothetical protein
MAIITSPIVTPSLTDTHTTAKIPLGTTVFTSEGGMAEYCYALSTLSQYAAVLIYPDFTAEMLTTTLAQDAGSGKKVGFPQVSIASTYYGWVHRMGKVTVRLADDCADNLPLFTTATAGELDDATVSNCLVLGVILPVTASLATALACIAGVPAIVAPYTNPA